MMLPFRAFRTSNLLLRASSVSLLFLWTAVPKTCAFAFPAVFPKSSSSYRCPPTLTKPSPFLATTATATATISHRMISNTDDDNNDSVDSDDGFDQDKFTQMQKKASSKIRQTDSEMDHLRHQQQVFDEMSVVFASGDTVPAALVPVYQHLAQKIMSTVQQQRAHAYGLLFSNTDTDDYREEEEELEPLPIPDSTYRVLDVATGTGAFYEYYMAAADAERAKMSLHITGVDLAPAMAKLAVKHAAAVLLQAIFESGRAAGEHEISVLQGDILQYAIDDDSQLFDAIVANACFGNFWDQSAVLQHLTSLLSLGGSLFITHPLGGDFVLKLHREDADTVPHLLPTVEQLRDLTLCLPLVVSEFTEQADIVTNDGDDDDAEHKSKAQSVPIYYAAMTRVRDSFLPHMIRLRGNVDTGYGRGGKKLGFPTANLPSRLFQDALKDVPTGVYFGWAVLEDSTGAKKGRNTYQKAVVNVGYSPTFEGQENTEKIVEAHLMIDPETTIMEPADFYDETMRLQLHGFLRPEIKFPSFPALIAQINADVADAKAALDQETNMLLQSDRFLTDACQSDGAENSWVGKDGGDTTASWEFQEIRVALQHLR
jgi:riboflavin kinase